MSQNAQQSTTNVERTEPTTGQSKVPIWIILLIGLLFYWGLNYVNNRGGWFNAQVFEPYRSYEEVDLNQPHNPEGDYLLLGKKTFENSCIACHQPTGLGKEGQFPPLAGSDWLTAAGPNRIGRIVLNGLTGPIRVVTVKNGTVSLNASMAQLGGAFSDEQIGAALTYVRQQWGNNASKITPDQITKIRAAIKGHPGPFTPDELLQIPVQDAPK